MQIEKIQAQDYSIIVGSDALRHLSLLLKQKSYSNCKFFVLLDENSHICCWQELVKSVPELAKAELIMIDSGEESKNIEICTQLWRVLSEHGADRQSVLINLGGGVIGDMGAFVAATFMRGIRFVQVPTTLLAMVDASVGGKAGVDLDLLKNQVGLFAKPEMVLVNPNYLSTLHEQILISGFAEIIKHALVADAQYWKEVVKCDPTNTAQVAALIPRSIHIKNNIVTNDPKEQGRRKLLNFGHTIGHAIETWSMESDVQTLMHGHAIAIGIICEAWLSFDKKWLSEEVLESIQALIQKHYEPVEIDEMSHHRLLELMQHDKKNEGGNINFTLLRNIGEGEVNQTATRENIIKALQYYRNINR